MNISFGCIDTNTQYRSSHSQRGDGAVATSRLGSNTEVSTIRWLPLPSFFRANVELFKLSTVQAAPQKSRRRT